jgi:hypothetical protein
MLVVVVGEDSAVVVGPANELVVAVVVYDEMVAAVLAVLTLAEVF